jgi:hypothetical protein
MMQQSQKGNDDDAPDAKTMRPNLRNTPPPMSMSGTRNPKVSTEAHPEATRGFLH